ncbi:MAG: 4Fe-4S dicluster domain-containing protein [Spirochaetaceae bacterium]|nr:4Fe-4S dicluster domain-containing protein [Spirochaetaceae bacterium]MBQ3024866.1 4Fe-4S dicluster domain-containing protein [Spirochaetaceae bacterium]MBQ7905249.1 4Fe-4S dicluster domain-containing protein [Spirochaetaceae bacterium]
MNQTVTDAVLARAKELLSNGTVNRVIGWEKGLFEDDQTPRIFTSVEELDKNFVYDEYSVATVSKYLIKETKKEGKILAFLKANDTYSFNQLVKEHRVNRENVYIVAVPSNSEAQKGKIHVVYDEIMDSDGKITSKKEESQEDKEAFNKERFEMVAKLEAMTADERFAFWQNELSKCIRCNACRNVCPACTCEQCVFDNPKSGIAQKAAADSFEEKMFHIIRAFHVAGRCTDCGECSRVCPQHIPLYLLNRKYIKDVDEIYGEYQAGEDTETRAPLNTYKTDDVEPSIVYQRDVTQGGIN